VPLNNNEKRGYAMKPMLLTSAGEWPTGDQWIYEAKYDGYRAILQWEEEVPAIISRNHRDLSTLFPELIDFCKHSYPKVKPFLPLTLDGEIVYLENNFRSNFSVVQSRGKTKSTQKIRQASKQFPCQYIAFDLLMAKGEDLQRLPLVERKKQLSQLFGKAGIPGKTTFYHRGQIQCIESYEQGDALWERIKKHNGEGMVAKRKNSLWTSGKRTTDWLKIKNWRYVSVIVHTFNKENDYFTGAIYKDNQLMEVTAFKHGLSDEEFQTLAAFFQTKGEKTSDSIWTLPPSICVDIACIDFDGKKLREPRFHSFRFDLTPEKCNWKTFQNQLHPIPEQVEITHPDKPVWPKMNLLKVDYLLYLETIAPYLLPFLQNRVLTTIRFPHGVPEEHFYQKNVPDYAPDFVQTKRIDDIDYIVCNDLETLFWLGNQLALEFHIPFQTVDTDCPTEIVFDLDPPSVNEFPLAMEAALRMKAIFDQFQLHSFVKTSGGKGLQVYLPLPKNRFTYDETRIFTEFICRFLVDRNPQMFTLERLKKKRGNKLYLDYVQHAEGKTIIAPYSPRGNEWGCVATPLLWEEVKEGLHPNNFTIPTVMERVKASGDPFNHFFEAGEKQPLKEVLEELKKILQQR
jgi:bifunctional non-homologous end joining protein LigD